MSHFFDQCTLKEEESREALVRDWKLNQQYPSRFFIAGVHTAQEFRRFYAKNFNCCQCLNPSHLPPPNSHFQPNSDWILESSWNFYQNMTPKAQAKWRRHLLREVERHSPNGLEEGIHAWDRVRSTSQGAVTCGDSAWEGHSLRWGQPCVGSQNPDAMGRASSWEFSLLGNVKASLDGRASIWGRGCWEDGRLLHKIKSIMLVNILKIIRARLLSVRKRSYKYGNREYSSYLDGVELDSEV